MFVVEAGFVVTLLLCFFPNLFGGDGNNNLTATTQSYPPYC